MNEVQTSNPAMSRSTSAVTPVKKPTDGGKDLPPMDKGTTEIVKEVANNSEAVQENLEEAVSRLNDYVQSSKRELQFSMDESTGRAVVTVIDSATSEVIRQLPDEVALDLARKLNEEEPIRLFSAHA
ncbi:flagellar protein FlaG [uncultured Pseudoteredinibacter sp.]|uniref:flagellar protein FlaG n=1 Tax=uncultured Pseudoteredinibacter sp. TaxID=1641701 RepID=UPI00262FE118|nr:flagellar protein FlaG [uncultured Pseudoteredinibacter sp.]